MIKYPELPTATTPHGSYKGWFSEKDLLAFADATYAERVAVLAEQYRGELDNLAQRNYKLRMENITAQQDMERLNWLEQYSKCFYNLK